MGLIYWLLQGYVVVVSCKALIQLDRLVDII
jgi:hypothetical protein